MQLQISLAQLNVQLGQPEANFSTARAWLAQNADLAAQEPEKEKIILFPELWTTGYDLSNTRELAKINATLLPELFQLARQYQVHIGGSLLLEHEDHIYNTFVFQSPDNPTPIVYEKIHLFRLMDEHLWLTPGNHLQQFSAPWGETGLAICYDLRFPEMFRKYAISGAQLILISAEWPIVRVTHWQTLLRARAIENQCFIAAVNSVGITGNETFGGRSAVISPWGEILIEGSSDKAELLCTEVALDEVNQTRSKIPVFQDRRPDLYE